MNQDDIFNMTEGDQWFRRNLRILESRSVGADWPLRLIARCKLRPRRVLEVGATYGWRLEEIRRCYRARCVGIEPSRAAIRFGKARYPHIDFRRGLMRKLPLKRAETFDVVIAAFVLHWVDRAALLCSVAELDRALAPGGFLVIADFLPERPVRRPYHHLPGGAVFTYKQDYAALFLSSGLYREIARVLFHHATRKTGVRIRRAERAACTVLQKQSQYREEV